MTAELPNESVELCVRQFPAEDLATARLASQQFSLYGRHEQLFRKLKTLGAIPENILDDNLRAFSRTMHENMSQTEIADSFKTKNYEPFINKLLIFAAGPNRAAMRYVLFASGKPNLNAALITVASRSYTNEAIDGLFQELLKRKADPCCIDKDGRTPFMLVAHYGHAAQLRMLLDKKIELTFRDQFNIALRWAARQNQDDCLDILLLEKNISLKEQKQFNLALRWAATNNHSELVQYLLNHHEFELSEIKAARAIARQQGYITISLNLTSAINAAQNPDPDRDLAHASFWQKLPLIAYDSASIAGAALEGGMATGVVAGAGYGLYKAYQYLPEGAALLIAIAAVTAGAAYAANQGTNYLRRGNN